MAVTPDDLTEFNRYAAKVLANGGAESMTELASRWEADRLSVSALQESHADAEAGRVHSAEEVFADVRKALGKK